MPMGIESVDTFMWKLVLKEFLYYGRKMPPRWKIEQYVSGTIRIMHYSLTDPGQEWVFILCTPCNVLSFSTNSCLVC